MIDWMVTTIRMGLSIGAMMVRQIRHWDAPSSEAASSTSVGMARMPAYTVTITNGNEHHRTSRSTRAKAL